MVSGTTTPIDGASVPGVADVQTWLSGLADPRLSDAERVDRIRALEDLKAMAAAAQARLAADLDDSVRAHHIDLKVPSAQRGRGVASLVGAARRESPARGSRHLGLAKVLVTEMRHTLAALESGAISEWRATLLARETSCLSREDRAEVDARLLGDPSVVEGWGDRRLVAEAAKLAYTLDPHSAVERVRRAEADRRVTIRPAPDTMTQLGALLPAAQGIAVWATLRRVADNLISQGDGRSRGQIMADTLVERVTGQTRADAVPVAVNLTISDETLFAAGTEPAWLTHYGPVPSGTARHLVATAVAEAIATLRRLYVTPTTGQLAAMDSSARCFPASLGLFIDLRDQICRTPWCDAPVRHHDHITEHQAGGETSGPNGQGLCELCSYAKQAPGWTANATGPPGQPHTVTTTLPTGHTLTSTAPRLPRPSRARHRADYSFGRHRLELAV